MNNQIKFNIMKDNNLSRNKFKKILCEIDENFTNKLSDRINFEEYSEKILSKGYCMEASIHKESVGIIVFYINNDTEEGYISLLSTIKKYENIGVGSQLVLRTIDIMKNKGINKIRLFTYKVNEKAIKFYIKKGFEIDKDKINERANEIALIYNLK